MNTTIKELDKSQVEITITVSPEEQQPHLLRAAEKISESTKIAGFRPGHAPFDVVAAQVGEMKILDAALEAIVRETYVAAVKNHELKAVGMPEITIEKSAPHNELVYRAKISLLPAITLPDFSKISVNCKMQPVSENEINEVLKDVRKMNSLETPSDEPAGATDKVTLDLDLLDGAVPLEGGQARDHIVYLDEPYYVPGFIEKILGAKAGADLEFILPFPKDHFQKLFAGKDITFKVRVKKVEKRELPPVDDSLAQKLGLKDETELRHNISENMNIEHKRKAEEAAEIEMMQKVVAAATFGELPTVLIDAERRRIFHDLQHSLEKHGITVEKYLADMKKSPEEMEASFTEQAENRVKMSLLTHAVAETEKIDVTQEELQTELEAIRDGYRNDAEAIKRLQNPEVQESILNSMRNRKVVEWLTEKMVKHEHE